MRHAAAPAWYGIVRHGTARPGNPRLLVDSMIEQTHRYAIICTSVSPVRIMRQFQGALEGARLQKWCDLVHGPQWVFVYTVTPWPYMPLRTRAHTHTHALCVRGPSTPGRPRQTRPDACFKQHFSAACSVHHIFCMHGLQHACIVFTTAQYH